MLFFLPCCASSSVYFPRDLRADSCCPGTTFCRSHVASCPPFQVGMTFSISSHIFLSPFRHHFLVPREDALPLSLSRPSRNLNDKCIYSSANGFFSPSAQHPVKSSGNRRKRPFPNRRRRSKSSIVIFFPMLRRLRFESHPLFSSLFER